LYIIAPSLWEGRDRLSLPLLTSLFQGEEPLLQASFWLVAGYLRQSNRVIFQLLQLWLIAGMGKQRFAERLTGILPLERGGGGGDDHFIG
jgi:hypothetical protein